MKFFTADLHTNHTNIIKYCKRPFNSVQEMDATLLKNINDVVMSDDELYHIGDFCFGDAAKYIDRINCNNIYFCLGSHDKSLWQAKNHPKIKKLADIIYIKDVTPQIVCNHCAQLVWDKSHHGSWHLFGHSHGNLGRGGAEFTGDKEISNALKLIVSKFKMIDVGVDTNDYKPYSYDKIKSIMEKKQGFFINRSIESVV